MKCRTQARGHRLLFGSHRAHAIRSPSGLHMNRPIAAVFAGRGPRILRMHRGYVNAPTVLSYLFRGVSIPATGGETLAASGAPT